MENQDKNIDSLFKNASQKTENNSFTPMESVWNRVEEKLDEKKKRQALPWFRYASVAAILLIFLSIGMFIFNDGNTINTPKAVPENNVTIIDDKEIVEEERKTPDHMSDKDAVVINKTQQPSSNTRNGKTTISKNNLGKYNPAPIVNDIAINKPLSGTVSDASQMPIPGAEVRVLGTNIVTATDLDGKFSINAKQGDRIEISYVGMKPQIVAANFEHLSVALEDTSQMLSDVVVEAYRSTTNAKSSPLATTVTSRTVQGSANASFVQTLQSQVPGLKIVQSSHESENGKDMERNDAGYDNMIHKGYIGDTIQTTNQEEYDSFFENQFENPKTTPLSTFSIDVDNASYTNVRRFLNNGQTVPKDAVRVEEMINYFKYNYAKPKGDEPFSINTEYSDAPWNPQHKLLKIGLKGREIASSNLPASNFVFLIDVSGSMSEQNKLPLLKESMKLLVKQMRKQDRVAIVVYAGAAGLVLPSTSGAEKDKIYNALEKLSAGGSTAGGEGIELAYKTAQENFIKKGNNRVILATDGDFNVGDSSDDDMQALIEDKRKSGVFLTCLGYGMGNYKDAKMEILADKGNGNYAYIDNMQEATRFLDKEFKGTMYAIAKDVKIQIEFNPKHVQSYRLIGYENRKLRDEDFINDSIDAGEIGSGHIVTALYEIIPVNVKSSFFTAEPKLKYSIPQIQKDSYNDELATIKFRYKKPDGNISKELVEVIPHAAVVLNNSSGDFKFAAAVAWFGLKLRDSNLIPDKDSQKIKALAKEGLQTDPDGYKAEFIRLVEMVD